MMQATEGPLKNPPVVLATGALSPEKQKLLNLAIIIIMGRQPTPHHSERIIIITIIIKPALPRSEEAVPAHQPGSDEAGP